MINVANENLIFLTQLDPNTREEILISCPDEFLLSLPADI
jgi:hypothetical protein